MIIRRNQLNRLADPCVHWAAADVAAVVAEATIAAVDTFVSAPSNLGSDGQGRSHMDTMLLATLVALLCVLQPATARQQVLAAARLGVTVTGLDEAAAVARAAELTGLLKEAIVPAVDEALAKELEEEASKTEAGDEGGTQSKAKSVAVGDTHFFVKSMDAMTPVHCPARLPPPRAAIAGI